MFHWIVFYSVIVHYILPSYTLRPAQIQKLIENHVALRAFLRWLRASFFTKAGLGYYGGHSVLHSISRKPKAAFGNVLKYTWYYNCNQETKVVLVIRNG